MFTLWILGSDHGVKAQGDGWLLTVALIEGTNLAAVDSTGFSDPYVVFTCNGKTRTSSIKFQILDPQWNGKQLKSSLLFVFWLLSLNAIYIMLIFRSMRNYIILGHRIRIVLNFLFLVNMHCICGHESVFVAPWAGHSEHWPCGLHFDHALKYYLVAYPNPLIQALVMGTSNHDLNIYACIVKIVWIKF